VPYWYLKFYGRPVGGLDGTAAQYVERIVEAPAKHVAQLKAYDTHEHIPGGADRVVATLLDEGVPHCPSCGFGSDTSTSPPNCPECGWQGTHPKRCKCQSAGCEECRA